MRSRRLMLTGFMGGFLLALTLVSCASMQDDIYIDSVSGSSEIYEFERRFSVLDAKAYESPDSVKSKEWRNDYESLISDIEGAVKDASLKNAVASRLYAIAGCAAFDCGDKGLAKKFYESSAGSFKGDARSLVLAGRLGLEKNIAGKMHLLSDKSLLRLELALESYLDGDYPASLAAFDEAFLSLDPFYRLAYGSLRETSWSLRDLSGDKGGSGLLSLRKLTVMQMILIADQNPHLLYNYTVGKKLSDNELYNKIAGSGLLNPVSAPLDGDNAVSKNDVVTRIIAARFLWNLYNQRLSGIDNLTKYSLRYKAGRLRSPVGDVGTGSPDFDAVLGCIENEIMHLEDGIDFGPDKEVSGAEFSGYAGKIK